jgi:hypothetical protein
VLAVGLLPDIIGYIYSVTVVNKYT